MESSEKIALLRDRAEMLRKARAFFERRHVLEVDCPALGFSAPVDLHIEVMQVPLKQGKVGYLHTSAEYGMKRLLSEGIGDIYQISHVFREGEIGPLHNPEFTMVEWYRCHVDFQQMIDETIDFMRLFLGDIRYESLTYSNAFKRYLNVDCAALCVQELYTLAQQHGIALAEDARNWDKDTLLQLLTSYLIEPHLGQGHFLVLIDFPATQSALARTMTLENGTEVACRFEVYLQGIELANGYHELSDSSEQQRRFEKTNAAREKAGKAALKIDERFLAALHAGLPDCCGVAVGFDRLLLLRNAQSTVADVLTFGWDAI